jgi:lysophospholipase L1-like esterase
MSKYNDVSSKKIFQLLFPKVRYFIISILTFLMGATTLFAKPTVYLLGDSTVQNYSYKSRPRQGWGARIPKYFNTNQIFDNRALGGRSSKSFYDEGHFKNILADLKKGDFLFIQFGHNDIKIDPKKHTEPETTFKEYLRLYIKGAKAKGAIPILITPMTTRSSYSTLTSKFEESLYVFSAYATAMRELGSEKNVSVVNLDRSSINYLNFIGFEGSANIFMTLQTYDWPSFTGDRNDGTHFQEIGASQMARLIALSIKELDIKNLSSNTL